MRSMLFIIGRFLFETTDPRQLLPKGQKRDYICCSKN